ncbi:MAG: hypothetical protein FWH31_01235 [Streptococcaceae bacterium]|nr:hypothetical protein [Streptococcaceae bacterium]
MDSIKVETVIQEKREQGQTIAIFCYDNLNNQKTIKTLSVQPDYLYLFEHSETVEEHISKIKTNRPDFLIIFAEEKNLIALTNFIYDWGGRHLLVAETIKTISREIASKIVKIDKAIIFKSLDTEIQYPNAYSDKVTKYWKALMESGKSYWDGLMYSVDRVNETEKSLCFEFAKTNYRNFIYSKEHDFRNDFHTCTTASIAIIETSDGYSVLGKMNKDSIFSEQYKCIGGTLDEEDFDGNVVNFERMFSREITEELGINIYDKKICRSNESKWLLIREEMAFVGLCNVIKLTISKNELIKIFNQKQRNSEDEKEVEHLLFIKTMDEINAIPKNEKADYVDILYHRYFEFEK